MFQLIPRPNSSANVVTKGKKEYFSEYYGVSCAVVLEPFLSQFVCRAMIEPAHIPFDPVGCGSMNVR
ncbi:MAG: hypothetical protein ACREPY_04945 [Rhodanobacteraceae bacterium]